MTSESQDTRLTSQPKDGTLHRAVSPITGLVICFLDQRKECLLLALQHHFQLHLVSHPGTDQDQPCFTSEASKQAGVCRVVCCWLYSSHMYILYSIPSTASCHLDVIHVSLATLNNASFICLHTLNYSSHVYTVLDTIYCILPMPFCTITHSYIFMYIFVFIPLHCVYEGVVVELLG